jgi:hypothetical protein
VTEPQATADEVRVLGGLDLEGLRAAWRIRFGEPPKLRSPELLRLLLAWRIQADAVGGLDAATRRRLRDGAAVGRSDHVGAGVRIAKEWRGQTHVVARTDRGYRWGDEDYRSLSAVAQAITGVKRNGPKFFGLREAEAA